VQPSKRAFDEPKKGRGAKKKMLKEICKILPVCVLVLTPAVAETPMEFTVGFPITVGAKRLPPGDFRVNFIGPGVVLIQNLATGDGAIVLTRKAKASKTPSRGIIRFNRYGNNSFLSQIWSPGYEYGRQINPTKMEVEMARRSAQGVEVATIQAKRR
jgi:hypothetical protein